MCRTKNMCAIVLGKHHCFAHKISVQLGTYRLISFLAYGVVQDGGTAGVFIEADIKAARQHHARPVLP